MAIPLIIATPGASNANSFGTRAEADIYFETVLHSSIPWPSNIAATSSIGSGTNGTISLVADDEGTEGNDFTIEVKNGVGVDQILDVTITDKDIVVTLGTDESGDPDDTKNTATLVAAAINNKLAGVLATASGTGVTPVPVTAIKNFTGGSYIEETKNPALIMAALLMTANITWTGFETSLTQNLPWPRSGMWRRNDMISIPDDEIPTELKYSQFELARLLIASDRTKEFDTAAQGLLGLKAGPVSFTFRDITLVGPSVIPSFPISLLVPSWILETSGLSGGTRDLIRT